jgi:hypothetical protein
VLGGFKIKNGNANYVTCFHRPTEQPGLHTEVGANKPRLFSFRAIFLTETFTVSYDSVTIILNNDTCRHVFTILHCSNFLHDICCLFPWAPLLLWTVCLVLKIFPFLATNLLWHVYPLLGNRSVNTFSRQRIRRQQSDNFRCYTTRCKYNRGRGVFYVVRINPLLGNRSCHLWADCLENVGTSTSQNPMGLHGLLQG